MSTQTLPAKNNGPQKAASPADGLRQLLERSKQQIALALPRHVTPERMIRMAMTVFGRTPKLQQCDPMTILACVVQASELGLELSGPLGHAFMVPYGKEAQFQVGYKGFFDLAFRSGKVSAFPMRRVHANDHLEVEYGTEQRIVHRPKLAGRGDVIAYYAAIYLKDGSRDFEFMSLEDVQAHFKQYVKNKGEGSPWKTAFDAMALKTCVRMLAKRCPLSVEIQKAAVLDEYAEAGIPQPLGVDFAPAAESGDDEGDRAFTDLCRRLEEVQTPGDMEALDAEATRRREHMGEENWKEFCHVRDERRRQLRPGREPGTEG